MMKQFVVSVVLLPVLCDLLARGQNTEDSLGEGNHNGNPAEQGYPQLLYTTENEIKLFHFGNNSKTSILSSEGRPIGMTSNSHTQNLYWTHNEVNRIAVHRLNLRNITKHEVVVNRGLGWPETLAIDWITGNLYYVELKTVTSSAHIGACDVERNFCVLLIHEDLVSPRGLALHPNQGIMFYSEWGSNAFIMKCLMDGSMCVKIIRSGLQWPNSLSLDEENSRLYFIDAGLDKIESSDFDGSNHLLIRSSGITHPFSLAVFKDKLYWSDWTSKSIFSCDKNGNNMETVLRESGASLLYSIAILDVGIQRKLRENSCLSANCSHFCTLKSSNSFQCHCPVEMVLDSHNQTTCLSCELNVHSPSDSKVNCNKTVARMTPKHFSCSAGFIESTSIPGSCVDVDECRPTTNKCEHFCTNTPGSFRCTCHSSYKLSDDRISCKAEGPAPLFVLLERDKIFVAEEGSETSYEIDTLNMPVCSVDVDSVNGYIYWSALDAGIIGRTPSNGSIQGEVMLTDLKRPNHLAYDWISNNVYFQSSYVEGGKTLYTTMVCSLGISKLCHKLYEYSGFLIVRYLNLSPVHKYLFLILEYLGSSVVWSTPLDTIDHSKMLLSQTGMSVDHVFNKLYVWDDKDSVWVTDFNTSSQYSVFNISQSLWRVDMTFRGMELYGSWIIFNNGSHQNRCSKKARGASEFTWLKWPNATNVVQFRILQTSLQTPGIDICKDKCTSNDTLCLPSRTEVAGYQCAPVYPGPLTTTTTRTTTTGTTPTTTTTTARISNTTATTTTTSTHGTATRKLPGITNRKPRKMTTKTHHETAKPFYVDEENELNTAERASVSMQVNQRTVSHSAAAAATETNGGVTLVSVVVVPIVVLIVILLIVAYILLRRPTSRNRSFLPKNRHGFTDRFRWFDRTRLRGAVSNCELRPNQNCTNNPVYDEGSPGFTEDDIYETVD